MAHGLRHRPLRRFPRARLRAAGRRCPRPPRARPPRRAARRTAGSRRARPRSPRSRARAARPARAAPRPRGPRRGRPANASPAPVVSTARAGTAGSSVPSGSSTAPVRAAREHDARAAAARRRRPSSVSLTIAMSKPATRSASMAFGGDGLTTAIAPSARAAASVPSCAARGTSPGQNHTAAPQALGRAGQRRWRPAARGSGSRPARRRRSARRRCACPRSPRAT